MNRVNLPRQTHKCRISQIISVFGSGAIIDFTDQTLMTAAPTEWKKFDIIHDERLEKKLNVDEFRIHKELECGEGVPFVRFPTWYFCPICKKIQPISKWEEEYKKKYKGKFMLKPECDKDKTSIIPISVLTVCKNGHIDDFPWIEWIHLDKGEICDNPKLIIVSNSGTLGLESFKIKCKNCGAIKSLNGAFDKTIFKKIIEGTIYKNLDDSYREKFKCKGHLPWKTEEKERYEKCDKNPIAILRNASSIYFPKIESSIVIPPYSDKLNIKIENSHEFEAFLSAKAKKERHGKLDCFLKEDFDDYIEDIAKEIGEEENLEIIKKIIVRKLENIDENNSRNVYRAEEYDALLGKISKNNFDSNDFKISCKKSTDYNMNEISGVTLVKKLREVRALVGHTRIIPPLPYIIGSNNEGGESKIVNIKKYNTRWYPAYEVRGEGIFIELNLKSIEQWIEMNSEIKERAENLSEKYNKDKGEELKREITPKFILIHTLAHALIRELSFECGYSATSLRERIYCDLPGEDKKMNGILIYTASGDSEGSLGGLVKQGNPEFLPEIIKNAINRIKWCSANPVCINSKGQGRDSLNLAACHNCVLLPETSCEEFNILLDRFMLVGSIENKKLGFFHDYI